MLKRAALDEVGFFDERFFMYSEDEDLCYRLRRKGWSVCFTAAGTAFHVGGASSSQYRSEMLRQFYLSQLLFLSKHRGRGSVFLYSVAMRASLRLKLLLARIRENSQHSTESADRLLALREAYTNFRRLKLSALNRSAR
jgi:GT2 family glycosyltransferase